MKALIGGPVVHIRRMESLAVLRMAFSAAAQGPYAVPSFNSDTIRAHGTHEDPCSGHGAGTLEPESRAARMRAGSNSEGFFATELCGVRVLIGSRPAELLYVSSYQINLKIPSDVPPEGVSEF